MRLLPRVEQSALSSSLRSCSIGMLGACAGGTFIAGFRRCGRIFGASVTSALTVEDSEMGVCMERLESDAVSGKMDGRGPLEYSDEVVVVADRLPLLFEGSDEVGVGSSDCVVCGYMDNTLTKQR